MDWIFDNLQIVALIAFGIVSIINQARKKKDEEDAQANLPPPVPVDPDVEAEQVREIIARRRAEREGRPPSVPSERMPREIDEDDGPLSGPAPGLDEWMQPPAPVAPAPRVAPPLIDEGVLARQRELEEQMAELKKAREAALARAKAAKDDCAYTLPSNRPELPVPGGARLPDFRNAAELRRAWLASEVLGKPKALQA